MSITILEKDEALARMLLLEMKRQGFTEEGEPSLLLVDLDDFDLPRDAHEGALCIGLSRAPELLPKSKTVGVEALLSLPFSVRELTEKLPRMRGSCQKDALRVVSGRITVGGRAVALSRAERAVFELLYENRHRPLEEAEIAAVLGESATATNAVAVYLYRLRKKLSLGGRNPIKTHRGKGYQWIEEVE